MKTEGQPGILGEAERIQRTASGLALRGLGWPTLVRNVTLVGLHNLEFCREVFETADEIFLVKYSCVAWLVFSFRARAQTFSFSITCTKTERSL